MSDITTIVQLYMRNNSKRLTQTDIFVLETIMHLAAKIERLES